VLRRHKHFGIANDRSAGVNTNASKCVAENAEGLGAGRIEARGFTRTVYLIFAAKSTTPARGTKVRRLIRDYATVGSGHQHL